MLRAVLKAVLEAVLVAVPLEGQEHRATQDINTFYRSLNCLICRPFPQCYHWPPSTLCRPTLSSR